MKTDKIDSILMCSECGQLFSLSIKKAGSPCPVHQCTGKTKEYESEGAVMANLLERRGFLLREFHVGLDTDQNCYIRLIFAEDYALPAVPDTFMIFHNHTNCAVIVGKDYGMTKLHREALALELATDKAALYKWVNSIT